MADQATVIDTLSFPQSHTWRCGEACASNESGRMFYLRARSGDGLPCAVAARANQRGPGRFRTCEEHTQWAWADRGRRRPTPPGSRLERPCAQSETGIDTGRRHFDGRTPCDGPDADVSWGRGGARISKRKGGCARCGATMPQIEAASAVSALLLHRLRQSWSVQRSKGARYGCSPRAWSSSTRHTCSGPSVACTPLPHERD